MDNSEKNSVLIVDDEEINLDVLNGILSPKYTVHTARGGVSALELSDKYIPDLILLDIIMPDMNGFEVLTALKSFEKTKHIPVIIITSLQSIEDEEKGLSLGAADFITKPFSNTIVQSRVEQHMQMINQIRAIERYAHDMQLILSTRLEAIANNYNGLIWSIDNMGVITYFNGQYLQKMGIASSFLIGKNIETMRIETWPLDIIDNVRKTFREGSQDWLSEIEGVVFRSHTTLIRDDEGNVNGIVGSSDDVTKLIKLQRDLEAAVKTAENANRTKSTFLARMSHDVRTPLNAVLGIAEIKLQNETLQPDIKEAFARIFNSGHLLLGIINDILDVSKIEAGKLELIPANYDIVSLLNDAVFFNMFKHENKQIDFILNVDENVPSELFGDELRIKQILNNLLSNAFKYTQEGEIELSLNVEPVSSDSVTLVFRVRDTGHGMTAEQISRLFDEYSRFNMETNKATEGTGLGMGIAQNLIQMMNGEILVESKPGKGSLFTVRLPQGNTGAPPLGKETAERLKQFRLVYEAKMEKIQIVREPIPFGKVLVVDDMEMNLYVAKEMLSPYGLQIDMAASGHEAIEKIKTNVYDLVFMDHMMPIMDGVETTREIRRLGKEYEKLPIIALTANAISGMKEMFLANGFNGFISKPIIIQELDMALQQWMLPEKITERKKSETTDEDEKYDSFLNGIEKIREISTKLGLNQLGGKRIYYNTLDIFYKKLVPECDNMTVSLDAKNMYNFMISVHAMKSMLTIIGALALSETALALEMAAKDDDIDFCTRLFGDFKETLLSLHQKLSVVFPDASENSGELSEEEKGPDNTDSVSAAEKSSTGKVLLVDDMDMILYVIKEKLSRYGLQVVTAASGKEAVEKIKTNVYDLVFMDHLMPEMDGIETTREIRKIGPEYEKLPVIALTANVDSNLEEMFLANGLNGFLSKPVAREKLEEILKKWLPVAV